MDVMVAHAKGESITNRLAELEPIANGIDELLWWTHALTAARA